MRFDFSGWGALALLLSQVPVAVAQDDAARAEAREHAGRATSEYNLGRFEEALAGYERAYEALPAPALFLNIGQCHRQLGNHGRAVFFFEGYRRGRPDASNRARVEDLVRESQTALGEAEQRRVAAEAERARLAAERVAAVEAERQERERRSALVLAAPVRPDVREDPPVPAYEEGWFWAVVIGGVTLAAGGTALGVALGSTESTVLPAGSPGTVDRR